MKSADISVVQCAISAYFDFFYNKGLDFFIFFGMELWISAAKGGRSLTEIFGAVLLANNYQSSEDDLD